MQEESSMPEKKMLAPTVFVLFFKIIEPEKELWLSHFIWNAQQSADLCVAVAALTFRRPYRHDAQTENMIPGNLSTLTVTIEYAVWPYNTTTVPTLFIFLFFLLWECVCFELRTFGALPLSAGFLWMSLNKSCQLSSPVWPAAERINRCLPLVPGQSEAIFPFPPSHKAVRMQWLNLPQRASARNGGGHQRDQPFLYVIRQKCFVLLFLEIRRFSEIKVLHTVIFLLLFLSSSFSCTSSYTEDLFHSLLQPLLSLKKADYIQISFSVCRAKLI